MWMRVLDIDLDFFLDVVSNESDSDDGRLTYGTPCSEKRLVKFLEARCGLDARAPVPGVTVEHHVEAFHYWHRLISEGRLDEQFEVVHVDAHADLGLGNDTWIYLVEDVVRRPVRDRMSDLREGRKGLNSGNFLAFATSTITRNGNHAT